MSFADVRMGESYRRDLGSSIHWCIIQCSNAAILIPALVLYFMIASEVRVAEEFPSSWCRVFTKSQILLGVEWRPKRKVFGAFEISEAIFDSFHGRSRWIRHVLSDPRVSESHIWPARVDKPSQAANSRHELLAEFKVERFRSMNFLRNWNCRLFEIFELEHLESR